MQETQAEIKYLPVPDVARRYSTTVRSIWRWTREGTFPAPIQLGTGGATRWSIADLEAWEASRAAAKKAG